MNRGDREEAQRNILTTLTVIGCTKLKVGGGIRPLKPGAEGHVGWCISPDGPDHFRKANENYINNKNQLTALWSSVTRPLALAMLLMLFLQQQHFRERDVF